MRLAVVAVLTIYIAQFTHGTVPEVSGENRYYDQKQTIEQKFRPTSHLQSLSQRHEWMRQAGIPTTDWDIANLLIEHESSWNPSAVNPSSGACGLGQQLPCGKWKHQWDEPVGALKDTHNYVLNRYGSWEQAWNFWQVNNWY